MKDFKPAPSQAPALNRLWFFGNALLITRRHDKKSLVYLPNATNIAHLELNSLSAKLLSDNVPDKWLLMLASSSTPMEARFHESKCLDAELVARLSKIHLSAIASYVTSAINDGQQPSLAGFVEKQFDFIVENTRVGEDLKSVWSDRFKTVCKALHVNIVRLSE